MFNTCLYRCLCLIHVYIGVCVCLIHVYIGVCVCLIHVYIGVCVCLIHVYIGVCVLIPVVCGMTTQGPPLSQVQVLMCMLEPSVRC